MANQIFSDEYLVRQTGLVEGEIVAEISPIYARTSLAITESDGLYTLPDDIREIDGVTWKGKRLFPIDREEAIIRDKNFLTNEAEPIYYLRSFDNLFEIRFFPIPNETIAAAGSSDSLFNQDIIEARVIVSYWKNTPTSTNTISIPPYISNNLLKSGVLSRAFRKEGRGQKIEAADYYERQYLRLIDKYRTVKSRMFGYKTKNIGFNGIMINKKKVFPHLPLDFLAENGLRPRLLNEDGTPLLTENGQFIYTE